MDDATVLNRDQAIAWFQSVGRNATARDWAMGETIMISIGVPETADGITVFPDAVCLYPLDDGRWALHEFRSCSADPTETYDDLAAAVRGANAHVERRERELAG